MNNKGVIAIFICPVAGAPMQQVTSVQALAGRGLQGDRYSLGQGSFNKKSGVGFRQVTLINELFFKRSGFTLIESRRNIVTSGDIELMGLINKQFGIGMARFRGVKYCEPCTRPSMLANKGDRFKKTFLDRGGLVAEVLESGTIEVGSIIITP